MKEHLRHSEKASEAKPFYRGFFAKTLLKILLSAAALFLSAITSVSAAWVEAPGQAVIIDGNLDNARREATDDALRQAAIQSGVHVNSQQEMRNGQLTKDKLDITALANIRHASVVKEWQEGGFFKVIVRANVEEKTQCRAEAGNEYRKTLLVTGFAQQQPESGALGGIDNADRALASYLSKQLNTRPGLLVFESSQYRLYDEVVNAPVAETAQRTVTKAVHVAKDMGAQFVLSGVIRDTSMHDREAMDTSIWSSMKRTLKMVNTNRAFALEVFIHDGFSGAIVFQKFYRLDAQWNLELNESAPFGSPAFWATPYGKAVGALLDDISWELEDALRCQPFMARITKVNGKKLHFDSGSNSGLRPGDKLSVYRTFSFYNADLLQYTELTDVKATLQVDQVQPQFARGELMIEAGRLNVQEDDILVAW
jgi:hypothetical protein